MNAEVKKLIRSERYHYFHRNGMCCRYGIYGLTREYFQQDDPKASRIKQNEIILTLPEPTLKVMQAVITADCNLNCIYCSFTANAPQLTQKRFSQTDLEVLCNRFNSEIGASGLLLITGGEPEMYPEAVDYLVDNIHGKIILFTNGTLTTRQRLEFYRNHNSGVLFSLDGDLFSQESVRLSKSGSYHRIAASLKMAQDVGLAYGISAVVGDHNIERLPELVQQIHTEFKPSSIGLNLPHQYGETAWTRIQEYTEALLEIFQYAKQSGLFIDQINRRLAPLILQQFRLRDCSAQGEKQVVFPSGIVTSCVNEAGLEHQVDWTEQIPINSAACSECFAIGICGGGCLYDGNAIYGQSRFDERNCFMTRNLLEHFIWEFWDELGPDAVNRDRLIERYGKLLHRSVGTYLSVGHDTI